MSAADQPTDVESALAGDAAQIAAFISRYQQHFVSTWADDTPAESVRFVSLDSEATGPDAKRDRLITIGAVSLRDGQIDLSDTFEAMLKITHNQAAVTVHGITREEAQHGMDEPEAVAAFVDYLGDGVIVGHHIGFDIELMNNACETHFGLTLRNRHIDTMDLTLHLDDSGAFDGGRKPNGFSLDTLCDLFGVAPHDRHTAGGDAFITALVFQRLLRLARKHGRTTLGQLAVPYPVGQPRG